MINWGTKSIFGQSGTWCLTLSSNNDFLALYLDYSCYRFILITLTNIQKLSSNFYVYFNFRKYLLDCVFLKELYVNVV